MRRKHVSCTLAELRDANCVAKSENFTKAQMTSSLSLGEIAWQEELATSGSYFIYTRSTNDLLKNLMEESVQDNRLLTRISVFLGWLLLNSHKSKFKKKSLFHICWNCIFLPLRLKRICGGGGSIYLLAHPCGPVGKMLFNCRRASW